MAIFKKRNLNDVDAFGDGIPFTGGNTRATREILTAQENIDKATVPPTLDELKNSFSTLSQKWEKEKYDIWRLLNFQADYFVNLFPYFTNSSKLNWAIQITKRIAFFYGIALIYKVGDSFIPLYITKSVVGANGSFIEIEATPAVSILTFQSSSPNNQINNNKLPRNLVIYKLNEFDLTNNCAILKWDTMALGAWYKFLPFIEQQKRINNMLITEGYGLIKKFTHKIRDTSAAATEMELFFNPENPYLQVGAEGEELNNRISSIDLNNSNSTNQFLLYMNEWQKYWYFILGRRFNADIKKERNITNEVEASQNNFDILENDNYIHLKSFIMDLQNLTGIEIKEIKEIKEDDNEI